jgi:hypothetical protein
MYQIKFSATDDADWGEAIELFDDDTNQPLELDEDTEFELEVTDCGSTLLSATTEDATISRPSDHIISWTFTRAQMQSLDATRTYAVGCRLITPDGAIEQVFVGSLALINGGMES